MRNQHVRISVTKLLIPESLSLFQEFQDIASEAGARFSAPSRLTDITPSNRDLITSFAGIQF